MTKYWLILLLYTGFFLPLLSVQAQPYTLETLTEQDGLSDNRITCFMKDRTGFMWIGTENGLNRYDGSEMKIYRPGQEKQRLSHEHINDVEQDSKGNLWISTWNGLNVLNPESDSLHVFLPGKNAYEQKESSISSSLIWDTYIDELDRVWIASDVRDLSYYHPERRRFIYLPWRAFVETKTHPGYAGYRSIQKIERKSKDELWLGTSIGLFSVQISTQTFTYYGGDVSGDFVGFHLDTLTHQLYFAQRKVYRLDITKNQIVQLRRAKDSFKFSQSSNSSFLMPTMNGIKEINKKTDCYSPVQLEDHNYFSIHHDRVNVVYYDQDLLWLGTFSGVKRIDGRLEVFPFIQIFPDTLSKDTGNVYAILQNEDDSLYYISSYTNHCLITRHIRTGEQKFVYSIEGKPLIECTKVYKDSKGIIWLLTKYAVFFKDKMSNRFQELKISTEHTNFSFSDMVEDTHGNYWFASLEQGIFVYNSVSKEFRRLTHEANNIFADRPTALWSDVKKESIWIADYSYGLFQTNGKDKAINYEADTNDSTTLQSALLTGITQDHSGAIWVTTTTGGISRYSASCQCFTTYTMKDGLPENSFYGIHTDSKGSLWATSEKGLTKLNASGKLMAQYSAKNGLPFNSLSTPIFTNRMNELMIGVKNGFLKFHPDSISLRSREFPVVLTSVLQGDKEYKAKENNEFTFEENEFTFSFAALCYSRSEEVRYVYQLQGYDKEWIEGGDKHSVRYTNLSEGTYTFLVKAYDYNNRESLNIARFTFEIHPPFWRATWFTISASVLALAGLFYLIAALVQRIRGQQVITRIATSLYEQDSLDRVFDMISKGCIDGLQFTTCRVFLVENALNTLNPPPHPRWTMFRKYTEKINLSTITKEKIYRSVPSLFTEDDSKKIRVSALTVPILVGNEVLAVIYSEHPKRFFFTYLHLRTVKEIGAICGVKIGKYFAEQSIRAKVARDLHDDIGSTLSSINIISQLALQQQDQPSTHLNRIAENSLRMMENMSDIIWSINPKNDSLDQVVIKMKEFAAEILEPKNMEYVFSVDDSILSLKLGVEKRKNIFLIFKEVINNAAKHSEGSEVTVSLQISNNTLYLYIADNGKGFDAATIKRGNGLINIEVRSKSMHGTLERISIPEKGTQIKLEVPIT